jgi:hypothetical protein
VARSELPVLFKVHGGEEVDHAGDGFFIAFPAARPAIECSAAIQRTPLEHRRRQGCAPQVRIGLHAAPAQGTTTYGRIISLSSCSTMWQCQTYRPAMSNLAFTVVIWPG